MPLGIKTADFEELDRLHKFLRDNAGLEKELETFKKCYKRMPGLFNLMEDTSNNKIIGGTAGKKQGENKIVLEAIAIKEERRNEGLGSRLLEFFEFNARDYGYIVSVGSDTSVTGFYKANGYKPEKILIHGPKNQINDEITSYEIENTRTENGEKYIYIHYQDFEEEKLLEEFNAEEVNIVLEKTI